MAISIDDIDISSQNNISTLCLSKAQIENIDIIIVRDEIQKHLNSVEAWKPPVSILIIEKEK